MWCDHPFSERNMAAKRAEGIGVVGGIVGGWARPNTAQNDSNYCFGCKILAPNFDFL